MQKTQKIRTAKDYVPPGTFAKAVLLNGADTNAGVHGQADTVPITMRVLDNGTLPNGGHSSLKGCFVTAAAYGDASSERGQIRLQRLSCIRKPSGWILDVPIEGTINDMGGSDGIRGHVVMRNNKLIWNAGVSGMLSGIGSAMQQSLTTQSVTPLGITNSIQPGKVAQSAAFGGANTALGKLADYYIKLADMYHPIVQVHAGSEVNIVFLKGFSLTEGLETTAITGATTSTSVEKTDSTAQTAASQNLMQNIKDSKIGQEVNINDNVDNEGAQ
jgi:conjugal transfer pilus assembly protein TraB